ncbi:unnamed protein product [Acanthosepion pharaonis]|uniref:Uncharacterized protein n=1 Tax=Acanthosepion pharaonis TaxID=158019 RepID=A0A812BH36_ACAPH|nr:unnamed protein product [Sepia pharaonis]
MLTDFSVTFLACGTLFRFYSIYLSIYLCYYYYYYYWSSPGISIFQLFPQFLTHRYPVLPLPSKPQITPFFPLLTLRSSNTSPTLIFRSPSSSSPPNHQMSPFSLTSSLSDLPILHSLPTPQISPFFLCLPSSLIFQLFPPLPNNQIFRFFPNPQIYQFLPPSNPQIFQFFLPPQPSDLPALPRHLTLRSPSSSPTTNPQIS